MTDRKITKKLAKEIASRLEPRDTVDQTALRDIVDMKTGSELDCWQLDTLTEWVYREVVRR